MADEKKIGIILTMDDQASPKMRGFGTTLSANRMAIRELAMGVTYLGTTFLGLGIALEKSQNPLAQSAGQMFAMVGGIMAAVGSAAHFVYAIGTMVKALKSLQIAQMLTQAFAGPTGWISLGVGAAVAGAAVAGVTMYERSQSRVATQVNNVHVTVQGSVTTERNLVNAIQKGLVIKQQQNNTSGIR